MTSYFYVKPCFLIGDWFFLLWQTLRSRYDSGSGWREDQKTSAYAERSGRTTTSISISHTHTHTEILPTVKRCPCRYLYNNEYQLTAWITNSVYGPLRLCEHASVCLSSNLSFSLLSSECCSSLNSCWIIFFCSSSSSIYLLFFFYRFLQTKDGLRFQNHPS